VKKITVFLVLLILFFVGCTIEPEPTTGPEPTQTPIPVIPAENPVVFALYDGVNLMYYDGENTTIAYTGKIEAASPAVLSIDNVLNYFDEYGNVESSNWLSIAPDAITIQEKPKTRDMVYKDDFWMLERIPPEVAYAQGGLYKDYAVIYYNNKQIGEWWENVWNPAQIITTGSGMILGIDDNTAYHNINGDENVLHAYDKGLAIYDVVDHDCWMSDSNGARKESFGFNYFYNCRWQLADEIWYGSNGYTWSYAKGLTENANCMYDLNSQPTYPVWMNLKHAQYCSVVPAGVVKENGEDILYWIECNLGILFKFVPSINQMIYVSRIYIGEGTKIYGSNQMDIIKPAWAESKLYFHNESSIKKYDPTTMTTAIFSNDMELIPWK
jgi:hypothetical protein